MAYHFDLSVGGVDEVFFSLFRRHNNIFAYFKVWLKYFVLPFHQEYAKIFLKECIQCELSFPLSFFVENVKFVKLIKR